MSDSLEPSVVEPLLSGSLGRPYRFLATCESTQSELGSELPEGACVAADVQRSGRGRRGRSWNAPAGRALLFSTLLRPPADAPIPQISLVAGLAVACALERQLERSVGLKWPNDVLVGGEKIAGILAEARAGAVVLGIGVNVNQVARELPSRPVFAATSMRLVDGHVRARARVLAEVLRELERAYTTWKETGLRELTASIAARDALRGIPVGCGELTGTGAGIDREGRLLVDTGHGLVAVASGEVTARVDPV